MAPYTLEEFGKVDLDHLVDELTLQEKISLLAAADWWKTVPVPRVGIPSVKCSDGPNGVRGSSHFLPTPAQCIPSATALGATFSTATVKAIGGLLARDCREKGSSFLLAPTVNIQRNPLNGRAFESFSEDGLLSGMIGASYVAGLQENGVGASIKHFVCNDSEDERMSCDSIVGERALREIYLLPFHLAIKHAQPWSVMTSYNRLNGVHCSEHKELLQGILREEWGWLGAVISDWTGTYSVEQALEAGLDIEYPGPAEWRGKLVSKQLTAGKLTANTIDDRARAALQLIQRSVNADIEIVRRNSEPERTRDSHEDREINRGAASEAIVLLKNDLDVLPLDKSAIKTLAILGPNAKTRTVSGGGSAYMTSSYVVTPFEGIISALDDTKVDVKYAAGCYAHRYLPMMDGSLFTENGELGWIASFINEGESEPVATHKLLGTRLRINDEKPKGLGDKFTVKMEGYFTPASSGPFEFGVSLVGRAYLLLDDKIILDNGMDGPQRPGSSFYGLGTEEETVSVDLVGGQKYKVTVQYTNVPRPITSAEPFNPKQPSLMMAAVRLGGAPKLDEDAALEDAVELARKSDAAVLVIGTTMDWETEASDRPSMDLAGRTDELVRRVIEANPKTIIVNQSGSVVTMPWAPQASTIVQSWFGGNETGNAIADVLFGKVNPSARLPLTFYKTIHDCTAHLNWGAESGRTLYGEGLFVGYRGALETRREPQFAFGHGLSYTSFEYFNIGVSSSFSSSAKSADDLSVTLTVDVVNTGRLPGKEVVQVYVSDPVSSFRRPQRELKAFAKTALLQPGATERVEITLDKLAFSYWNDTTHNWVAEKGTFILSVAKDSTNEGQLVAKEVELEKTFTWRGL